MRRQIQRLNVQNNLVIEQIAEDYAITLKSNIDEVNKLAGILKIRDDPIVRRYLIFAAGRINEKIKASLKFGIDPISAGGKISEEIIRGDITKARIAKAEMSELGYDLSTMDFFSEEHYNQLRHNQMMRNFDTNFGSTGFQKKQQQGLEKTYGYYLEALSGKRDQGKFADDTEIQRKRIGGKLYALRKIQPRETQFVVHGHFEPPEGSAINQQLKNEQIRIEQQQKIARRHRILQKFVIGIEQRGLEQGMEKFKSIPPKKEVLREAPEESKEPIPISEKKTIEKESVKKQMTTGEEGFAKKQITEQQINDIALSLDIVRHRGKGNDKEWEKSQDAENLRQFERIKRDNPRLAEQITQKTKELEEANQPARDMLENEETAKKLKDKIKKYYESDVNKFANVVTTDDFMKKFDKLVNSQQKDQLSEQEIKLVRQVQDHYIDTFAMAMVKNIQGKDYDGKKNYISVLDKIKRKEPELYKLIQDRHVLILKTPETLREVQIDASLATSYTDTYSDTPEFDEQFDNFLSAQKMFLILREGKNYYLMFFDKNNIHQFQNSLKRKGQITLDVMRNLKSQKLIDFYSQFSIKEYDNEEQAHIIKKLGEQDFGSQNLLRDGYVKEIVGILNK